MCVCIEYKIGIFIYRYITTISILTNNYSFPRYVTEKRISKLYGTHKYTQDDVLVTGEKKKHQHHRIAKHHIYCWSSSSENDTIQYIIIRSFVFVCVHMIYSKHDWSIENECMWPRPLAFLGILLLQITL